MGIVICCPYKHLVDQWEDDVKAFGFKYIIGHSGSTQKNWKKELERTVKYYATGAKDNFSFVTTNTTFKSKFVQDLLSSAKREMVLVIDEAHNFGTSKLVKLLDDRFNYRLALSATLDRHNDLIGTVQLYDYFEKKCIVYSLKQAIIQY